MTDEITYNLTVRIDTLHTAHTIIRGSSLLYKFKHC